MSHIGLLALVATASAYGCGGDSTTDTGPRLGLPDATAIARIQASIEGQRDSGVATTEGFGEVLQLLESLDSGWQPTTETASGYSVSISITSPQKAPLLILWIGDDWVGAFDMQGKVHVRQQLTPEKREALLRSVGVDPAAILSPEVEQ